MSLSVTKREITVELRDLGLREGDIVILHSSLASMGRVEGGAEGVVEAFLSVLGETGTLVVPTFGALGAVTEAVKAHPRSVKSIHPLASVAAIGAAAEDLCREHWKAETAHAEDTPYLGIARKGGHVCLLGVDQDRNTTLHTVEALLKLPYLSNVEKTFETSEGTVTKSWKYFPGPHRNFVGLDRLFRESGKMRMGRIGNAMVRLIKSQDLIDIAFNAGLENPALALCDNPNCTDCVQQRAAILHARLARESFTLVASAGLSGCCLAEIVANLKASGVGAVELDFLEGRPVHTLSAEKLAAAIAELRKRGCQVASLRSPVITEKNKALLDVAAANDVPRVILPISEAAPAYAALAAEKGRAVSFFNAALDGLHASRILLEIQNRKLAAGFTFNAANFARAGERPFSYSFKQKLRRFVDQLDLEDCTCDGAQQILAHGHAEVKEMVSIMRCASFSGAIVLGYGNRLVGNLRDVVARFEVLLEAM
jgi:aminoglycoside 3-N-acetyltransferase